MKVTIIEQTDLDGVTINVNSNTNKIESSGTTNSSNSSVQALTFGNKLKSISYPSELLFRNINGSSVGVCVGYLDNNKYYGDRPDTGIVYDIFTDKKLIKTADGNLIDELSDLSGENVILNVYRENNTITMSYSNSSYDFPPISTITKVNGVAIPELALNWTKTPTKYKPYNSLEATDAFNYTVTFTLPDNISFEGYSTTLNLESIERSDDSGRETSIDLVGIAESASSTKYVYSFLDEDNYYSNSIIRRIAYGG